MRSHVEQIKRKAGAEYDRFKDDVKEEIERVVTRLYSMKVVVIVGVVAFLVGGFFGYQAG